MEMLNAITKMEQHDLTEEQREHLKLLRQNIEAREPSLCDWPPK
jgi:hypothetical protein